MLQNKGHFSPFFHFCWLMTFIGAHIADGWFSKRANFRNKSSRIIYNIFNTQFDNSKILKIWVSADFQQSQTTVGWGRGRDGTWRHFGLKLTKKRKTFKVIDFKNFNISNLKVFKVFFHQFLWVFSNFFFQNIMGREVGSGGRVIQEPECPNKSLRLSLPESC